MTRLIFSMVLLTIGIIPALAPAQPAYYGPNAYYPYSYQQQYQPVYPAPYQRAYPTPPTAKKPVKNPPVEIWLSKGVGRVGDYWFRALGGMSSHPTPKGTFTVKAKHRDFYSNKYDAEMPRSVFFTEQCAIHVGSLRVKSHGCIHVDWEAGQQIFDYAKVGKTKVKVYK